MHDPKKIFWTEGGNMKQQGPMRGKGKSWRGLVILGVVWMLVLSCSSMVDVSTTATPQPTDTPEATVTNANTPTKKASSAPTATPDLEATQAMEATATMDAAYDVVVKKLNAMKISPQGGRVAHYQEEAIVATSEGYNKSGYEVLEMGEDVLNAVIHTNVTWTATTGVSVCGVVFNKVGSNWDNYYEFDMLKLSGFPYWYAAKISNGIYRGGQQNPENAIDVKDDATNNVVIMVQDKTITYYVNEKRIQTSSDAGLVKPGGFGFTSWQESGSTQCTFSNIWVWTWDQ
jgi:hypothetical protein